MMKAIQDKFTAELNTHGITAEVTFCRSDMFSILVDDVAQFERAKKIVTAIPAVAFDSESRDVECGNVAFFRF